MRRRTGTLPAAERSQAATRTALLEAAAEVFAQHGFTAATVREICERANANIAAVSYHFGDKEQLYNEVLKHALRCAYEKYPPALGLPSSAPAEDRLRAFIESFLMRIFDQGRHSWHGRLMSREMIEPTPALNDLVEEIIRPLAGQLHGIVKDLIEGDASPEEVRLCALSVVSQCTFYHHCGPLIGRLFPDLKLGPQTIRELAGHITQFSLAGIRDRRSPALKIRR